MRIQLGNNRGMGKTIEEKMKEYNEMKQGIKNTSTIIGKNRYSEEFLSAPTGVVMLVALGIIIFGLVIAFIAFNDVKIVFFKEGKVYTKADVTRVYRSTKYQDGTSLNIVYEANGKEYQRTLQINEDPSNFSITSDIRVYYFEDNPGMVYDAYTQYDGVGTLLIGVAIAGLGIYVIFCKIKNDGKKRK